MAAIDQHMLCRMPVLRAAELWSEYRGVHCPSRATLARWIHTGVRGIRLQAELIGDRWFCRPADIVLLHTKLTEKRLAPRRSST